MDNYIKVQQLLDEVSKDPYINRDKLVFIKYLLEQSLTKTNTLDETKTIKRTIEGIDKLLYKIR